MNTTQSNTALVQRFVTESDIADNSMSQYRTAILHFFKWLKQNDRSERKPTKVDVVQYKKHLNNSGLAQTTIGNYMTPLRRYFEWLELEGVYINIAKGVKYPKRYKGYKKEPLTDTEVVKLMQAINTTTITGKRDYAFITLMLFLGLREVEISRLNVCDIYNDGDVIKLFIQGKGKQAKDDYMILTEDTFEPIQEYLLQRNFNDDSVLFCSSSNRNKDERISSGSLSRIIKNYMTIAGIKRKNLTAHSLRHTAANTFMNLNGENIHQLQGFMRHSTTATSEIYIRMRKEWKESHIKNAEIMKGAYPALRKLKAETKEKYINSA